MEIKELSTLNTEEIKHVIYEAFSREPWNDKWKSNEQLTKYVLGLIDNKNSLSLGLMNDGKIIGVAVGRIKYWYDGDEYWIDDLAILPQAQGKGCGSEFLNLMEKYLKEKNIKKTVLFTNKNIPAYYFYEKNGFSEKTQRTVFEKNYF